MTDTKWVCEIVTPNGWKVVKASRDKKRCLHAELTYIALGHLTRTRQKPLKGVHA